MVAPSDRAMDRRDPKCSARRPLFFHPSRERLDLARVVIGGGILRNLEIVWGRRPHHLFGRHYHLWLPAALPALSGTAALVGWGADPGGSGRSALLGCASTDVYVYSGQPAVMADGTQQGAPTPAAMGSGSFCALDQSPCRICIRS